MKRNWKDKTLTSEFRCCYPELPERVWKVLVDGASKQDRQAIRQIPKEEYDSCDVSGVDGVFAILERTPGERYLFELKNELLTGRYDCRLAPAADGGTEVWFRDQITFRSRMAWLVSSYGMPLKRSQRIRAEDLRRKLEQKGDACWIGSDKAGG